MSERAERLREVVARACGEAFGDGVQTLYDEQDSIDLLRAIVEEFGLSSGDLQVCGCGCGQLVLRHESKDKVVRALATLLEAAGAEAWRKLARAIIDANDDLEESTKACLVAITGLLVTIEDRALAADREEGTR